MKKITITTESEGKRTSVTAEGIGADEAFDLMRFMFQPIEDISIGPSFDGIIDFGASNAYCQWDPSSWVGEKPTMIDKEPYVTGSVRNAEEAHESVCASIKAQGEREKVASIAAAADVLVSIVSDHVLTPCFGRDLGQPMSVATSKSVVDYIEKNYTYLTDRDADGNVTLFGVPVTVAS